MARRNSAAPIAPENEHPVFRSLRDAPIDDEPETEQERHDIEEARRDVAEGRVYSDDEVRRMLGLDE